MPANNQQKKRCTHSISQGNIIPKPYNNGRKSFNKSVHTIFNSSMLNKPSQQTLGVHTIALVV